MGKAGVLPEEEDAPLTLHGSLSHTTTLIISLTPAGEPFARLAGVCMTQAFRSRNRPSPGLSAFQG